MCGRKRVLLYISRLLLRSPPNEKKLNRGPFSASFEYKIKVMDYLYVYLLS